MNPTNKRAYIRHMYSGPRKSRKKVQATLKRHHGNSSNDFYRLDAWRNKKKKVVEETADCPVVFSPNTTQDNDQLSNPSTASSGMSFAESCADARDSGPVEKQKFDETDICDDDDDDSDTLVESNVCRVCLALDVKMYDLKDIELREMFQNITGIVVTENDHSLLERLCWECAGRLKAAAVFRKKALLSDALLQGLANTGEQIRKKDVTLIKENQDYLKSAGTLSIVEVFHTVQIDAEYESAPCVSKNSDTDIVQNIDRIDMIELTESVFKENNCQMDVENESMIEAPIKTEIEYDPICPNTCEENRNILLDTNPLFSNNIPLREDTSNSAYRSPPPGCSQVIPSDCEKKIKKTIIKIVNRDSISKIESKKSKEVINHDTLKGGAKLKNINLKLGGISKKTSNKKLVKKTQVTANTDEEYLGLESFEF